MGLGFDQKLRHAFDMSASRPDVKPEDTGLPDSYITLALYRSDTVLTRIVELQDRRFNIFHEYKKAPPCPPDEVIPGRKLCGVLNEAIRMMGDGKTIGAGHFLRSVVKMTLDWEPCDLKYLGFSGGGVIHNTFSAETILWGLGYDAWTPISKAPELRTILENLDARDPIEDHQYLLMMEGARLVFRPTSILNSYHMTSSNNRTCQRLAVLPHLRDTYGGFRASEILELEDLINSPAAQEADLQRFFERHPAFFRTWGYRDVFPQVCLSHDGEGDLIPDFVLVDPDLQRAMVLDLKLPQKKVIVGTKNRTRFSSAVQEAMAQLLKYRDWFEDTRNRASLKDRFGLELYRPRLAVVIGRSRDFADEVQRQRLASQRHDFDVVTYDDISSQAKRRLLLIGSANR
jgi:hypothetical protein